MQLSRRVKAMQASPVRKLVPYSIAAQKQGKKVYHLNIGQPDIKTPSEFMDAIRAFDEETIAYSVANGEPSLIKAISKYYKRFGMDFAEDEILITNGGSEALIFAAIAVCNAGEEILVPEPFYTNYNGFTTAVDVAIRPITTKAEEGFHLPSKEEILACVTDKTRAIMISNPGNPTGVVYSKEELETLAEVAKEKDLFIISDEVYREFTYDGLTCTSFGNIKGVEDRVIIVDSVSKRYSACGARIGSLCTKNKDFIKEVTKLCQTRLCVPTLEQIGAAALYEVSEDYLKEVNTEYQKRRDITFEALSKMDNVVCEKPTGAFYVIAKLPIDDAEKFALWLLTDFEDNKETVMVSPAGDFYATKGLGKDEIRIAYILEEKALKRALELLDKAIKAYNNK
ncbi:pyridoxal phosphate-dependent aminotransferase [Francisella philomiragia]|uniref:Aminotransferase n=1 Tax=Francisella philomiragia TaxID=28110 RepID=A0AAW3DDX4_9GAMM|nr:pyridoxal phosphate-dependent aminotransferase [Francisella philomiragia]AJI55491.1 beta-eliminating lyase family protein [Francisella philomiragia]KFJ43835.1 beta-eliminating lyase family protein [Francisella philomiragia]MBK2025036.1 pyridoxal phosphate-dependent aminotransferase [Francisella philomiragia]MBK2253286.1 pyridoxal phosphate-dependent aminotransferase [Francisella philomiragia]MBK2254818.1 pyridoxal phosphate-dependent aminotransferase [Francisella philomiragia]